MIDINKKYTTRDGREVTIYATGGLGNYNVHGAVKEINGEWKVNSWTNTGANDISYECKDDLIKVWEPQDKEPIWCWVYEDEVVRWIRFWDAKNNCSFQASGKRDGMVWKHYAKVEHIEQWMLDMQAQLED